MLREVFGFVFRGISKCIQVLKLFVLDGEITFFHLMIFLIFGNILIYVLMFLKQIATVQEEDKNKEYKKERKYRR